jgi:NadR type nicotinamide-nucleotide adenylyltransferase
MPIKKIAIVGPESTGKSTLSEQLSARFQTPWVPEYARQYLDQLDRPYQKTDLLEIARGQIALEDEAEKKADGLLICDTNLVVIKIWSEVKYGHCDEWIVEQMKLRHYHLHLLMDIDMPWEYDPYREHPHMREFLFQKYEEELIAMGETYSVVRGSYDQRLAAGIEACLQVLGWKNP